MIKLITMKINFIRKWYNTNNKYETREEIKQEFIDFLDWYERSNYKQMYGKDAYREAFDKYMEEKDIAFTGEIRKLLGANTRNTKKEVLFAIGMISFTIIFVIVMLMLLDHFNIYAAIDNFIRKF